MSDRPLLSVCIPAYNRAEHLAPLLDSILSQEIDDWECVICEDGSPQRARIREIALGYVSRDPRFRYLENARTLGFDGNFRELVTQARGRFLFIMGNDDVVHPGAFVAVADAAARHPRLGVILRAFAFFRGSPDHIVQVSRYYAEECHFPAGRAAILATYRRLVAMSGIVLHRDAAAAVATARWDGTLFYQLWLAGNILCDHDAVYLPQLLALFRKDGTPEFGTAEAERGRFTPGVQPPDTDLRMISAHFEIAAAIEAERGVPIVEALRADYARYMYPTFAHQAHVPWREWWRFYRDLGAMGFDRYPAFHGWFAILSVLGAARTDAILQWIRRTVGHTPNLSASARP